VVIVQARMGSTRLPGKVLQDLGGATMLGRVVARVRRSTLGKAVVVATSAARGDDDVAEECRRLGVTVFRGSETDVLDRYYKAAVKHEADVVVRITADCPFIDPSLMDELHGAFEERRPDYASNCLVRTYPRGLDAEIFTAGALTHAWREALLPHHRAHVTPYIYEHPARFKLLSVTSKEDHGELRWTVDTPEDLELARGLYSRLGNRDDFSWRDVLDIVGAHPQLARVNQHVRQKELIEG